MVELQEHLAEFENENIAVFAMSYDPVEVLRTFAAAHDVAFDLLSDQGSEVIRELGLLNRQFAAPGSTKQSANDRNIGLPHPGTLVLDKDGIVVDRLFSVTHRPRPSASRLLRQATGRPARVVKSSKSQRDVVTIEATLASSGFRPLQINELSVEVRVSDGWHLYTKPVPEGYTALAVSLDADDLISVLPPQLPQGRPFTMDGINERLYVVEGDISITLPFQLAGAGFELDGQRRPALSEKAPKATVKLIVSVEYQACSATECLPPQMQKVTLDIDEVAQLRPQ